MIIEVISSIFTVYNVVKYFNEDYFYARQTAERENTHCEFKYVGKTIVEDGERLFELTDPQGKKYILFKQVCENNEK
jgi:hypothetical protein